MGLLIRGLILGFSIAAPVGPIGVLCIRRTLAHGRLSGFVSGLGAASADAIYGSIAAFGLTLITNFLVSKQDVLGLIGGIFLCYLGIQTFFDSPEPIKENGIDVNQKLNGAYSLKSLLSDYGSTFATVNLDRLLEKLVNKGKKEKNGLFNNKKNSKKNSQKN